MKLCCETLGQMLEDTGDRGLFVTPTSKTGAPIWQLVFRSVRDDASLPFTSSPVTLELRETIGFCPYCGRRLESYRARASEILALVSNDTA